MRSQVSSLSLHDALPICQERMSRVPQPGAVVDEEASGLDFHRHPRQLELHALEFADRTAELLALLDVRSAEHTSELQSPCNILCRLLLETNNISEAPTKF